MARGPELCGVSLMRLTCVAGILALLFWSERIVVFMNVEQDNIHQEHATQGAKTILPKYGLTVDSEKNDLPTEAAGTKMRAKKLGKIPVVRATINSDDANSEKSVPQKTPKDGYDNLSRAAYYQRRKEKVNPHDFHYIIKEEKFCEKLSEPPYLLVLICSYHDREYSRLAVRETWGSVSQTQSWVDGRPLKQAVKILFFVGTHIVSSWNKKIAHESQIHSDIILEDYTESPFNASIKTIGAFKWAAAFCPQAKYVLKVEEDVFIDIPKVLDILSHSNTMYGARHAKFSVQRNGQWAVPYSVFPFETFPPFLGGPAYAMSLDLAKRVYEASEYFPMIVLEDAYVTGVLREVVGAEIKQFEEFGNWGSRQPSSCEVAHGKVIAGNRLEADDMLFLWEDLKDSHLREKCG
ncbi:beta-1,3-galactosyltransferase 1 [Lingula anatina]|uniref:Hexosyltransferase n=1 Tax=Lingula anatina TaxID=7574 RepID=A0A1S3I359_LINAN|nr:beta-1,3-galactosyltransferase 1 [Lingula anatina]|eukprot:XP_013392705.1 beta-1,3-galactosyltransferase 1 [Lingula anatina]